jgi:signal transduction histidine kinase
MDSTPNNDHNRQPLQVLATVTHDLRNLLSVVLGYGELLHDRLQARDYAEAVSILEHVQSGARHAHALVVNYGDILRMADHTLTLHLQPVEINRVLRRAIELYEIDARRRGVTLTTCFEDDLSPLKGDPVALERVFTNLIHNALKFTPAGGMVTLKSAQYDGTIVATITDTGCGIAPTVIPLLFDISQRP